MSRDMCCWWVWQIVPCPVLFQRCPPDGASFVHYNKKEEEELKKEEEEVLKKEGEELKDEEGN